MPLWRPTRKIKRDIMDLQESFSTAIHNMKEMLGSGKIGKVLGSTITASSGNGNMTEGKNVKLFLERRVGGNVITVHLGHSLESMASGPDLLPFA
jgi:predicted dehydrogenase